MNLSNQQVQTHTSPIFFLDNIFYFPMETQCDLSEFSFNDKLILVQHAIKKYEKEEQVIEKLKSILSEKDIQRSIDTLIGTQKVRRIGPEILQNNESHTELPELPENLQPIIENL